MRDLTFRNNELLVKPTSMKRHGPLRSWSRDGAVTVAVLVFLGRLAPAAVLAASQPPQPAHPAKAMAVPSQASQGPAPPAPPLPQGAQYSSLRSYLLHQQSLVNQLDERVRGLELRYSPKRLDDLERRLASLDNKLDSILPALERRFDKLAEALNTHDHKSSLSKEQLVHKVDNVLDRITALQLSAGNIQEQVGASVNSTQAQLAALANATSAVLVGTRAVEDLRGSQDEAEEDSTPSCSRVTTDVETATKAIKQHVDSKTDIMSSKVSNLYNDMWRRINSLESLAKSGVSVGNATRRDVLELRVLVQAMQGMQSQQRNPQTQTRQPSTQRAKPPSGNWELALETLGQEVQERLNDVERTLYEQVTNVQLAQDIFLRTCDRLDDKGEELEEKISKVMDRLIDMVMRQDKDLVETHRLLKSHNHQVSRALANATEGGKRLQHTILSLSEQTSEGSKRVESLVRHVLDAVHNETLTLASAFQNVSERVAAPGSGTTGCSASIGPSDDETWSALLQQANETVGQLQDQSDPPLLQGPTKSQPDPLQESILSHHETATSPVDTAGAQVEPLPLESTSSPAQNITESHRYEESPLLMVIHGLQRLADTYSAQPQRNKTFEQFINEILPQTPSSSHTAKGGSSDITTLEDDDYLTNDNQDETDYSF